jgi:hypothetical protein
VARAPLESTAAHRLPTGSLARNSHGVSVPLARENQVARGLFDLYEAWILGRVDVARAGQVDSHIQPDAAGPIATENIVNVLDDLKWLP